MATAYSTSLRLALPVTGELNGTWGDVVNQQITSMVEQAVAGYASIAITGAYTLTTANGASDQARNMALKFTGTLGANANITVPTASKLYFVNNATTGGFAIVVKTSAGTGVTIPNGGLRIVYCDGTNVVDAISDLPSGASVNGVTIVTLSDTQTLTNKTITTPTLTLKQSTAPTPTAEGDIQWDTDGDFIVVGNGTGQTSIPSIASTHTLTNKTVNLTNNTLTGTKAEFDTACSDDNFLYVGSTTYVGKDSATGAASLPSGTTAQRPGSPATGMFRYNSTNAAFEGYNGTAWAGVGGASGGGGNPFVYENDQTVSVNYTLTTGKNGMTAGPITVANGVSVTVPNGSVWTIV